MFIDATDDGGKGRDFIFNEGRIIPVYVYYPGERRGYILRAGGEKSGYISNIEGEYKILLAVRGPEVERLEKGVRRLYQEVSVLEEIPQVLWPKLGTLTGERRFRVCMVSELYRATRKICLLQEELSADENPR